MKINVPEQKKMELNLRIPVTGLVASSVYGKTKKDW